jgi:hypothetical protein
VPSFFSDQYLYSLHVLYIVAPRLTLSFRGISSNNFLPICGLIANVTQLNRIINYGCNISTLCRRRRALICRLSVPPGTLVTSAAAASASLGTSRWLIPSVIHTGAFLGGADDLVVGTGENVEFVVDLFAEVGVASYAVAECEVCVGV